MESRDNIVFLFDMLTMTMRNKNDVVMMSCEVVRQNPRYINQFKRLPSSDQLAVMTQVSPSEDEFDGDFDIDLEKSAKSSTTFSDSSAMMMSKHSMNMGCYEINLGTVRGQRIHALHLILLPLLPILILIVQNYSTFDFNKVRQSFNLRLVKYFVPFTVDYLPNKLIQCKSK